MKKLIITTKMKRTAVSSQVNNVNGHFTKQQGQQHRGPLTVSSLPEALRHLPQHLAEVLPLVAGGLFHHEADVQGAVLGAPEVPTPTDRDFSVRRAAGRGI